MLIAEADAKTWTPEAVKKAYVKALVTIEETVMRDRPRLSRSTFRYVHDTDDIKAQNEIYGMWGDRKPKVMPKHKQKAQRRYSAQEIEWASFVLCGGSYHGSRKVLPWMSGILAKSVVKDSFEAWGKQMANRRLGLEKRSMSDVCADVGVSLATFNRYVTGAGEQIAKALNEANVDAW